MSDIVKRLRDVAEYNTPQDPREWCKHAANEIDRLEQDNKRLRAALCRVADAYEDTCPAASFDSNVVRQVREALDEDV